jgi:subtilisin family serine protease
MKKKFAVFLILSLVLVTLCSANFAVADNSKVRVIVGFKEDPDSEIIESFGGDIMDKHDKSSTIICNFPERAIESLRKNPKIEYVEEDAIMTTQGYVVESELVNSWGVERIGGGIVQDYGNNGEGIKVAVIDTGINYLHTELQPNLALNAAGKVDGFNAITGTNDANDDNGHGSHCAGIIAAIKGDGLSTPTTLDDRVVGVAPKVVLYPVKVLDKTGSGYVSDIAEGINWAVTEGKVDVISISLGGPSGSTELQTAIQNAYNAGIVVVAAAGNSGTARFGSNVIYPAKYSTVIAVAATDSNNVRAYFSSTGPEVDLSAPGVSIISSILNDDTYYMSGTSMACPHVAGAAALLLAAHPDYTPSQVVDTLTASADDLGSTGKDNLYGYGLVDIDAAINLATQQLIAPAQTVTKTKGTTTGLISAIAIDDGTVMTLKPATSGTSRVLDLNFKVTVTKEQSQIDSLTVKCIIAYSSKVTQTFYIYDYTTRTWTSLGTNSIDATETKVTFSTSNAARYVSPNGEISARIYVSTKSSFTGSLDQFVFEANYIP